MATKYHELEDPLGRKAVSRDGWFIGFIERGRKGWSAYTVDMTPIVIDCASEIEAANRCWNERPRALVKMSALLANLGKEAET